MYLSQPTDEHLVELMSWFSTEYELNIWSGPNFSFPFDLHSFKSNLKLETLASFSLVSAKSELLGFGPYYLRLGKCHLARLVINPSFRGQGTVACLIQRGNNRNVCFASEQYFAAYERIKEWPWLTTTLSKREALTGSSRITPSKMDRPVG